MIDIFQAIIFGVVQGLTEWLPISSSGHLAILQLAMGLKVPIFFDLILHIGSLTGIFAIYRRDIISIISSIFTLFKLYLHFGNQQAVRRYSTKESDRELIKLLILGMLPTGAMGILFKSFFEYSFYDTNAIVLGFMVTGILVLVTKFLKTGDKKLGNADALLIGMGQGLSIFSSISRSGTTLSIGMFRGLRKDSLIKYSFLLSIPAILGASILDIAGANKEAIAQMFTIPITSYAVGALLSAIVGFVSIKFLIRVINNESFYLFSFYCFGIGLVTFFRL